MPTKTKKKRQRRLPTMEVQIDQGLEDLADVYVEARDARMVHGKIEQEKATLLLAMMHERGVTVYERADGSLIEIRALEKVKVNRPKAEENGEDE